MVLKHSQHKGIEMELKTLYRMKVLTCLLTFINPDPSSLTQLSNEALKMISKELYYHIQMKTCYS